MLFRSVSQSRYEESDTKPALDGIGYQDSLNQYRAWWTAETQVDSSITNTAAGKTVAWIDYMTNFNKTFGNFAAGESEDFMVMNRNYERDEEDDSLISDLSTYIDPSKYNQILMGLYMLIGRYFCLLLLHFRFLNILMSCSYLFSQSRYYCYHESVCSYVIFGIYSCFPFCVD